MKIGKMEIAILNELKKFLKAFMKKDIVFNLNCLICFQSFISGSSETTTLKECMHSYHCECYKKLMVISPDIKCPICYEEVDQYDNIILIFRALLNIQAIFYPNLYNIIYINEGPYFKWDYPKSSEELEKNNLLVKKTKKVINYEEKKKREVNKLLLEKENETFKNEFNKISNENISRINEIKNKQILLNRQDEIEDYNKAYDLVLENEIQNLLSNEDFVKREKEIIYSSLFPQEKEKIEKEIKNEVSSSINLHHDLEKAKQEVIAKKNNEFHTNCIKLKNDHIEHMNNIDDAFMFKLNSIQNIFHMNKETYDKINIIVNEKIKDEENDDTEFDHYEVVDKQ